MGHANSKANDMETEEAKNNIESLQNEEMEETLTAENIVLLKEELTEEDIENISKSIKKLSFIAELDEGSIKSFSQKFMKCRNVWNEEWLFKQGSIANYFFIIKRGRVEVVKDGFLMRTLKEGEGFGELALLYGNRRASGIKILKEYSKDNQYFVIKKETFYLVRESINSPLNQRFFDLLNEHEDFKYLTKRQLQNLAQNANQINFNENQRILTRFDLPHALFFILKGQVRLKYKEGNVVLLGPNQFFGYYGHKEIQYSVIATQETSCFTIGRQNFLTIIRQKGSTLFLSARLKNILTVHEKLASEFDSAQIEILSSLFYFRSVKMYETLNIHRNEIKKLKVPINCSSNNEIIGLSDLLYGNRIFREDYLASKQGYCAEIESNNFLKFFNRNSTEQLLNNKKPFTNENCVKVKSLKIRPNCRNIVKREPKFQIIFQEIQVSKDQEKETEKLKRLLSILQKMNFHFIRSYYSFNTEKLSHSLQLEHIPGVYLHDVASEIGILPIPIARFYFANLILSLEYLHEKNIIFRNFKFESFKVDRFGYIWLYDLSECIEKDEAQKCSEQALGSPHWHSPEIIQGKEFSFGVDFWGLGILMYIVTMGHYPFGKYEKSKQIINNSILNDDLAFPINCRSKNLKELLATLLDKESEKRNQLSWRRIKEMDFFSSMDWQKLKKKEIESPYLPDLIKIKDH